MGDILPIQSNESFPKRLYIFSAFLGRYWMKNRIFAKYPNIKHQLEKGKE